MAAITERDVRSSVAATASSATVCSPVIHYLAWVTALTVFPLIWAGGLVTTTKAGMAVPDWPGTYGYNMFLYPWETWFFGPWDLFIEHGHRLLGSLAGIWCIGLVVLSCGLRAPSVVRWMSLAALALVIVQGVMGGVRVLQVDREVARIHGCLGPAFFAFLAVLVVVTSRWWQAVADRGFWLSRAEEETGTRVGARAELVRLRGGLLRTLQNQRHVTLVLWALAYLQLVFGASMRHVPETADPHYFRILVWFHVVGAVLVCVSAAVLSFTRGCPVPGLCWPRRLLLGAVGLQILLGLGTWVMRYNFPEWFANELFAQAHLIVSNDFYQVQIVSAHVALGSFILAVGAFSAARIWRAEHGLRTVE